MIGRIFQVVLMFDLFFIIYVWVAVGEWLFFFSVTHKHISDRRFSVVSAATVCRFDVEPVHSASVSGETCNGTYLARDGIDSETVRFVV